MHVHPRVASSFLIPVLGAMLLVPRVATAQCEPQWQSGDPYPFLQGRVTSTTVWDPDGNGPIPTYLVVGGFDLSGGNVSRSGVVAFDGTRWLPLGSPPGGAVTALGGWNNRLVAALTVTTVPTTTQTIATYDGTTWQTLGTAGGVAGTVRAFAVHGGELFAGGVFNSVSGIPASNVARWSGGGWSALGSGVVGSVNALADYSGLLYVGGSFTSAGGSPSIRKLASWDGSFWSAAGNPSGSVTSLASRESTTPAASYLFVGGSFGTIGGIQASNLARFNAGSNTWTDFGPWPGPSGGSCTALLLRSFGLVGYEITVASSDQSSPPTVWRWTGSAWVSLGSAVGIQDLYVVSALTYYNFEYVLADAGAVPAVRRFDGAGWAPILGPGIAGDVRAILDLGTEVVIGGTFRAISGVATNGIARGNPGAWRPLGSGFDGEVRALARAANGDIVAAGTFTTAGGQTVNHVARWNGSGWASVGLGTNGPVHALLSLPNGDLVLGGSFTLAGGIPAANVARVNGSSWGAFGTGTNSLVRALARTADGSLIAGGEFTQAGSVPATRVARWTGSSWTALGAGLGNSVFALVGMQNGDLVAGGWFAGGVQRWNGGAWSILGQNLTSAQPTSLAELPNGDVVAGGRFALTNPPASATLLRFAGGSPTEPGVEGASVDALVVRPSGELLVGGDFWSADNLSSGNYARWRAPCPASVVSYGAGCPGSAGTLSLAATSAPWLGGTYRATATGIAPGSLVIEVVGLSAVSVPLPLSGPGCLLLASTNVVQTLTPVGNIAKTALGVPNDLALLGGILRHQVVQVEMSGASVTRLNSTNGLRLTIGRI